MFYSSHAFEYLLLDGCAGEHSPDFTRLPGNPSYDNNTATITVMQE